MITCTGCHKRKSIDQFYKGPSYLHGISLRCKSCVRAYQNTLHASKPRKATAEESRPKKRCYTCDGIVKERDPEIVRCNRKECLNSQKVLGLTRTSPKYKVSELMKAQEKKLATDGIVQTGSRGREYSDYISDLVRYRGSDASD